jgi:signal transduction histidine kinase
MNINHHSKGKSTFTQATRLEELAGGLPNSKTGKIIEALRDNYSTLVVQGEILLLVTNESLQIDFMSNSVCGVLHYEEKNLIQESIFSILAPESHQQLKDAVRKVKNGSGKTYRLQDLVLYCTNHYQHFFDGLIINLSQDERVGGYLFYLHNISDRHKIENQLKDLNLELDSFVYKASHDLRAPLSSLSGLINLTESEFPTEANPHFQLMKASVYRLDKFIQQLAHYSRNNNTRPDSETIDFGEFIREIINDYRYLMNADKIHFEIEPSSAQKIYSDPFRLRVILNNLLANAIKYHQTRQEYPFIRIQLLDTPRDFTISVQDNGSGISPQYQSKIFEMFTRAHNQSDGSGLGLYIVKKALEKLKGHISVESTLGEGSLFRVKIPK